MIGSAINGATINARAINGSLAAEPVPPPVSDDVSPTGIGAVVDMRRSDRRQKQADRFWADWETRRREAIHDAMYPPTPIEDFIDEATDAFDDVERRRRADDDALAILLMAM